MTQCSFCGVDSYDLIKDHLKEKNLKEENLTEDEYIEISNIVDQKMIWWNPEYDLGHCNRLETECGDKYYKEIERIDGD